MGVECKDMEKSDVKADWLTFRNANIDDAVFIAKGFHMAMLYEDVPEEQVTLFARTICTREDVLYSWRNTVIAQVDGKDAGMLTSYDGRFYHKMRLRTMGLVKEHLGIEFPNMEDEAVEGEYYLDSLAVLPEFRGRGVGRSLLLRGIAEGRKKGLCVTLAVDPVNERAKVLYRSLGFLPAGKLFIFGHDYEKMKVQGVGVRLLTEWTEAEFHQMKRLMVALSDHCELTPAMLDETVRNSKVYVAEEDGMIVGTATLSLFWSPTGRKASIEDVVVLPEYQGSGIGRKLVEYLLESSKRFAPICISLTSRPTRIAANELYRKLGFKQKETNVYRYVIE